MIGSILVALITTLGTIWTSSTELRKNTAGIRENKDKPEAINVQGSAFKLPVGTIIASLLQPSEFAKEVGDPETFDLKSSKWTLADSEPISGTRWAALRDEPYGKGEFDSSVMISRESALFGSGEGGFWRSDA